jgi:hypothetical protein
MVTGEWVMSPGEWLLARGESLLAEDAQAGSTKRRGLLSSFCWAWLKAYGSNMS